MTQQYQTLNHEMTRLYGTNVAQELENKHCLKTLKALLSKGCGRGEIGKHKGLKTSYITGLVTRVTPNLFKHISYLVDITSVASLSKGVARCRNRVTTNQNEMMKRMDQLELNLEMEVWVITKDKMGGYHHKRSKVKTGNKGKRPALNKTYGSARA
tara:strand:+ start:80 stop:547 length:468 start_codon:yes stop_codon:yes gene_type:complete